ncbi:MAG: DUF4974 domain-containing protein [Odoribacteraceae bacterium]|jgi:ferric-dicitrate binding protein FerR (iron transport regulator)|nr:DUF4974 domain-containing protein [Odoribacteraceae bacterium]
MIGEEEDNVLEFSNHLLNHRATCDDEEVSAWLSDEEHVRVIDRSALVNRVLDPRHFSEWKEPEWQRLYARVGWGRRRWWWRRLPVAASVLVGLSLLFLLLRGEGDRAPGVWIEEVEIVPGEYKAELVLAGGEVVSLARESREIRGDASLRVHNDSARGLVYGKAERRDTASLIHYNTLKVPAGGFFPVELSDGTKIWLNASSELRYPVVFGEGERVVTLSGEAYFEVKEDAGRPFTVQLRRSRVTVLGTTFNINAYEDAGQVYTTLVEGSVSFLSEATGEHLVLTPGTRGTLEVASGALSARAVETEVYTAWKEGIFYFKEMTLEEIMRVLSRWYQVEVLYESQRLKHERYNGKMPMYSGIEDVLRKIELSGSVRCRIEGRRLVIFE